jgi:glucose-6-phosphate isomerase
MVPSGLAGADVLELLSSASAVSPILEADSEENPALWLAAALTRIPAGSSFKDKFLIESDDLPGFGDWVEQLVAESTGKNQRGTLPVVITSSAPEISFKPLDTLHTRFGVSLGSADVAFEGSLGELFLLWEYATAAAGWILGIDPFNQPNVESAKIAARALLDSPISSQETDFVDRGISVVAKGFKLEGSTVEAALQQLLALAKEDSYISVHAYLNRIALPQFEQLRDLLANKTRRPTTFGWGPRFLHSTGQYHKGGPRQGVFLQLVQKSDFDLAVPDRPFSFGTLIGAQAAGDANVIEANGLPVLTLILTNPLADLELMKKVIG